MRRQHITCPLCGWTSWSIDDYQKRYCGHCHRFHGDMNDWEIAAAHRRRINFEEFSRTLLGRLICRLYRLTPSSTWRSS